MMQKKSISDNFQNVDVIAAIVMAKNEENSKPKFRLFINAAEMGLGAEIIDMSQSVRNQIRNRLLTTATEIIATLPRYKSNICEIIEDTWRQYYQ
jgi:diacylglycerol kinase (ATP)